MTRGHACLLAVVWIGCRAHGEATAPPPEKPPPAAVGGGLRPSSGEMLVEHFARTMEIRDSVIHGDLGRARQLARALRLHDLPEKFPERWKPFIDELRTTATDGEGMQTVESGGQIVARLATTCGDCHRVMGGPKFTIGEPPAQAPGNTAQMTRHAWAVDRMWLGLIQPSDEAWKRGADVLAAAPLVRTGGKIDVVLEGRVHALAGLARMETGEAVPQAPPNAPLRTTTYGELLTTCASCHALP